MSNKATEPAGQVPALIEPTQIVRAADSESVAAALSEYRQMQIALDLAMPDCLMDIKGKQFRRKPYWRAVATAFNLTVECVSEEWKSGEKDWGWLVVYRAIAPNGRHADGDGACFASEKRGPARTVHNVRSHAHTRGYNRCVSNLVGFGEVSADELTEQAIREMREGSQPARGSVAPPSDPGPVRVNLPEPARTTPIAATPNYEVRCPKCQSPMWDNRGQREEQQRDIEAGTRTKKARPAWSCVENPNRERGHEFWTDDDRLKNETGNNPNHAAIAEHDVTDRYNEGGRDYNEISPEEIF